MENVGFLVEESYYSRNPHEVKKTQGELLLVLLATFSLGCFFRSIVFNILKILPKIAYYHVLILAMQMMLIPEPLTTYHALISAMQIILMPEPLITYML